MDEKVHVNVGTIGHIDHGKPTLTAAILLASLVAVVLLGRSVRRHLPEHHLSPDSKDGVKLAMGLVATMTALLLGLLVRSAKATYDTQRSEVMQMAAKVAFLDRVLELYGPETADARAQFRDTMAEAVRRMWPEDANAPPRRRPIRPGTSPIAIRRPRSSP